MHSLEFFIETQKPSFEDENKTLRDYFANQPTNKRKLATPSQYIANNRHSTIATGYTINTSMRALHGLAT